MLGLRSQTIAVLQNSSPVGQRTSFASVYNRYSGGVGWSCTGSGQCVGDHVRGLWAQAGCTAREERSIEQLWLFFLQELICLLNGCWQRFQVCCRLKQNNPAHPPQHTHTHRIKIAKNGPGSLAQWIEHRPMNQRGVGSIPSQGTCLGYSRPGPQ